MGGGLSFLGLSSASHSSSEGQDSPVSASMTPPIPSILGSLESSELADDGSEEEAGDADDISEEDAEDADDSVSLLLQEVALRLAVTFGFFLGKESLMMMGLTLGHTYGQL